MVFGKPSSTNPCTRQSVLFTLLWTSPRIISLFAVKCYIWVYLESTEFSCIELLQAYSSDFSFLGDLIGDEFSGAYVDESVFSCKHSGDLGAFCCGGADDEDSGWALGSVAFDSKFHHSCQLSQQRLPPHSAINLKVEILINLSNSLHMHEILLF